MHTLSRLLTASLWGSGGTGQKPTLGSTVSVPFGGGR